MSIIRTVHDKDNPYVILNKSCLDNPKLSLKAKGLHSYLMSKPDDWKVMLGQLTKAHKDGKDSINSTLKELEQSGYIFRRPQEQGKDGRMKPVDMDVYETPHRDGETGDGFTAAVKPVTENPPLLSNKILSNDIPNNDSENIRVEQSDLFNSVSPSLELQKIPPTADASVAKSEKSKSSKKSKPSGYINPDTGVGTTDIRNAYLEKLEEYESGCQINFGQLGRTAKNMATNGITPQQIVDTYVLLKSEDWWQTKHVSLETVGKNLGAKSRANGLPQIIDSSRREAWNEPEPYTPEEIAALEIQNALDIERYRREGF